MLYVCFIIYLRLKTTTNVNRCSAVVSMQYIIAVINATEPSDLYLELVCSIILLLIVVLCFRLKVNLSRAIYNSGPECATIRTQVSYRRVLVSWSVYEICRQIGHGRYYENYLGKKVKKNTKNNLGHRTLLIAI